MKEPIRGKYVNPKYGIQIKPKIVNVIVTFAPSGQVENCPASSHVGSPTVWYVENKLETVKFNIACHRHYNPGVDYEIVIVDNGSEDEEMLRYLRKLQNEGIKILRRENVGFSFAGFKFAWEQLKNDYDYFLFNEQDGVPSRDGWLLEILQKFHSEKGIGAVGNNIEEFDLTKLYAELKTLCPYIGDRDYTFNLDGFMTFTSSTILRQVDNIGGLFTLPVMGDHHAERNELIFQQPILELGYKIISFHDGNHIVYAGIQFLDEDPEYINIPKENLSPMVLAHTRLFVLKEHFNWYTTKNE